MLKKRKTKDTKSKILRDKSKENKEKSDEEKIELEEIVEKSPKINLQNISKLNANSFTNMKFIDIEAPVLERIAGQPAGPKFISTGRTPSSSENNNSESKGFTYISNAGQSKESKYIPSGHSGASPERINPLSAGRNFSEFNLPKQETMEMRWSPDVRVEPSFVETIRTPIERIDSSKRGRENPFELDQKKYAKYDPDLPKHSLLP